MKLSYSKRLTRNIYAPEEILVCGGIPVEVSAYGAQTYIWSPNVSLSSDTGNVIEISTLSSITYTLEGIDSIGCSSSILVPTTATDDLVWMSAQAVTCQGYSDGSITILLKVQLFHLFSILLMVVKIILIFSLLIT